MGTSPRGLAVIINNENFPKKQHKRHGSKVDVQNLKDLWEKLDFKVEIYQDLGAMETLTTLESVVKNPLLRVTDMFVACIMSHGEKDVIICHDGIYLDTEQILIKFACIELKDKPKFIMFQACRGGNIDYGVSKMVMTDSSQGQNPTKDPIWKDMLIAYSTIPNYLSYRDTEDGSWFVESLVKVFMNDACNIELRLLLRNVEDTMNAIPHQQGFKQSIEVSSRGIKKSLFFNPGLSRKNNLEKFTTGTGVRETNRVDKVVKNPNLTNTDYVKEIHTTDLASTNANLKKGNYKL